MFLFISGAEIVFIFFIVLLIFGADKIPSIAKSLAKGVNQERTATNEIKSEIQKSVDTKNSAGGMGKELKNQVDKVKEDFDELTDSIKRDL
jgi:sec-independent protein translocase protein TatA